MDNSKKVLALNYESNIQNYNSDFCILLYNYRLYSKKMDDVSLFTSIVEKWRKHTVLHRFGARVPGPVIIVRRSLCVKVPPIFSHMYYKNQHLSMRQHE